MWKIIIFSFAIFSKYSNGAVLDIYKDCTSSDDDDTKVRCANLDFSNANEITVQTSYNDDGHYYPETETFEFESSKVPVFPSNFFQLFPNVDTLILFGIGLRRIEKEDFEDSNGVKVIYLGLNQLEELPENVFANVKDISRLSIEANLISRLHRTSFSGLSKLEILNLGYNNIRELPVGIFDDLKSLRTIDLTENHIEIIDENLFKNIPQVETIQLGNNKIKHIERNTFMHLMLYILELQQNRFEELHTASMTGLFVEKGEVKKLFVDGSVVYLSAGNNQLNEVQISNISGTSSIALGVDSNIDLTFLKNARSIKTLSFVGGSPNINSLAEIYQSLPSLKEIVVSNISLQEIPDNLFANLNSVEKIEVSENPLKYTTVEDFVTLDKLESLSLASNQIEEIDYRTLFDDAKKLKTVDLSGNKFKCSYLAQLLAYMKTKNIKHTSLSKTSTVPIDPNEHQLGCI